MLRCVGDASKIVHLHRPTVPDRDCAGLVFAERVAGYNFPPVAYEAVEMTALICVSGPRRVSTLVIENSEPNFRNGSKPVVEHGR